MQRSDPSASNTGGHLQLRALTLTTEHGTPKATVRREGKCQNSGPHRICVGELGRSRRG